MLLPPLLRRLWNAWKAVGHRIGIVMGFVLLSVLWITIFGIYALCRKCAGLLKRPSPLASYWQPVPPDYPNSLDHEF